MIAIPLIANSLEHTVELIFDCIFLKLHNVKLYYHHCNCNLHLHYIILLPLPFVNTVLHYEPPISVMFLVHERKKQQINCLIILIVIAPSLYTTRNVLLPFLSSEI